MQNGDTDKFCCPTAPDTSCSEGGFTCHVDKKPQSCGTPGQCGCFKVADTVGTTTFCGNRQVFCETLVQCTSTAQCVTAGLTCHTCALNTCCTDPGQPFLGVCVPNCGVSQSAGSGVTTPDGLALIL